MIILFKIIPLSDIKELFDQYGIELTDHPHEKDFEWQLIFSGKHDLSEMYQLNHKIIIEYLTELIFSEKLILRHSSKSI